MATAVRRRKETPKASTCAPINVKLFDWSMRSVKSQTPNHCWPLLSASYLCLLPSQACSRFLTTRLHERKHGEQTVRFIQFCRIQFCSACVWPFMSRVWHISQSPMTDYNEEQKNEIEALESIYPDEFVGELGPHVVRIRSRVEPSVGLF